MIHLSFETKVVRLRDGLAELTVIRLKCAITFKQQDGTWSRSHLAILDTGAHTSVLPEKLWRDAEREIVTEYDLVGVNSRPECRIPAWLGKVTCRLHDDFGNYSRELVMPAFLAQSNQVPLILGFANLLDQFEVVFNYPAQKAHLVPING